MRPTGFMLLVLGCILPVVAVLVIRRTGGDDPAPAARPLLTIEEGGGLVFRDREQTLRPNLLGRTYSLTFPYGNTGRETLTLTGFTNSCGCLGVEFHPAVLAPGAWGEAVVTVDAKGRFGKVGASVSVQNDRGAPVSFTAYIELPPAPVLADELIIPAGAAEGSLLISGGAPGLPLRILLPPASDRPAITARIDSADGLRLVCAPTAMRPAASRVTIRLGYGRDLYVDRLVRVVAE